MLLNYLYSNFHEESHFSEVIGTSLPELRRWMDARIAPEASYIFESKGHSSSFVSTHDECETYRFHLKGHAQWYQSLSRLGLKEEAQARCYFFHRYDAAKKGFMGSELGRELRRAASDVEPRFDLDLANSTWEHFLGGVYGICTRDGQPETIFLKQAGVKFVEALSSKGPGLLAADELELLQRTVELLDGVASDFAPHEVPLSSRQRCVKDVRANFLSKISMPESDMTAI